MAEQRYVDASTIPGVFVIHGKAYAEEAGRVYQVTGAEYYNGQLVPVLDIPQTDET